MYRTNTDGYSKEHNRLLYPRSAYNIPILNKRDLDHCHSNFYDLKVTVSKEILKIKDDVQKPKLEWMKMFNPIYVYKYLTAKPVEYMIHVVIRIYDIKQKCFCYEMRKCFCLEAKDLIDNKPTENVINEILKTMFGEYLATTLMDAENVHDSKLTYSTRIESEVFNTPYTITLKNVGDSDKALYSLEFKRINSTRGKTTLRFSNKEYLTNTMKSIVDILYA